ncbi:hypothetical protein BGZ73_001768 [Actinomortierella ambigua]|nr:hypothetical protein BGZ73_001768 [Actinomortierella ambigua]
MSTRKSKFGHLFGDDGPSKDKDLFKDPLASILAPPTTTTSTTSTSASRISTSTSGTGIGSSALAAAKKSPPGSTSGSRSSSRLQNHALLSSLTHQHSGSGSSSIFDSPLLSDASSSTSANSSSRRDFLFGDSGSTSAGSRRTSTPPLAKTGSPAMIPVSKSPSVSSVSSFTAGGATARVTSPLETDESPLGKPSAGSRPSSTEPISRPSSSASHSSQHSAKSTARASQASTVEADLSSPTHNRSTSSGKDTTDANETAPSPAVDSPLGLPPPRNITPKPSSRQLSSKESIPATSTATKKKVASELPTNPLLSSSTAAAASISRTSNSPSPSIQTFEALTRTRSTSPLVVSSPTPSASSNASATLTGTNFFERSTESSETNTTLVESSRVADETLPSSPSSSTSGYSTAAFPPMQALDNAFASDNLFVPADPVFSDSLFDTSLPSTLAPSSSLHVLSSATVTRASTFPVPSTTLAASSSATCAGPLSTQPPLRRSTLSLDQGVAGESEDDNPWDTTLAADLERMRVKTSQTAVRVDYGDPEAGVSFFSERQPAAFTMPVVKAKQERKIFASLPEEEGIFGPSNVRAHHPPRQQGASSQQQHDQSAAATRKHGASASRGGADDVDGFRADQAIFGGSDMSSSAMASFTTTQSQAQTQWNIAAAVEAASQDPDFLGGGSLLSQSTTKVLEIMQMPKDKLEKDVSAQEVFDNPWE